MSKKKKPLDDFVMGRAPVQVNQTAGPMKDRRTRRARSRAAKKQNALRDQDE